MNVVCLVGRLVREPDVRYNSDHMAIARFTLAIDRPTKTGKETDFPNCVAFGKTAEVIEKYCKKGKQIGVSGRIQTGSYEKNGEKVYTTTVAVDRLDLLGKKEESGDVPEEHYSSPVPGFEELTDDLPF